MAIIKFLDGKSEVVNSSTATTVWEVLSAKVKPTKEQKLFCDNVSDVFLSWRHAPDDYIEASQDVVFPMAIATWTVTHEGVPTRPEPSDELGRTFGKRWGLLEHGYASERAKKYFGKG